MDNCNDWPEITPQDMALMNDLFPHYVFFQRGYNRSFPDSGTAFYCTCCTTRFVIYDIRRTMELWEAQLLDACEHNRQSVCPRCGKPVTMKDLDKTGRRKTLRENRTVLLLHGDGEALYADALALYKHYEHEQDLAALPEYWICSRFLFQLGSVRQEDYQTLGAEVSVRWERDKLGCRKRVSEPFKVGPCFNYRHQPYAIINRDVIAENPKFRYCRYFDEWHPEDTEKFSDFVSYMTAYCIYPRQVEMLVKCGWREPVSDLVYNRNKNTAAMTWEESNPLKAFRVNKTELGYLMDRKPPLEVLKVRNYIRKHWGKTWSIPACREFYDAFGFGALRFLAEYHIEPGKFLRYITSFDLPAYLDPFLFYKDYLEAAYNLGWCMEHSAVLFPRDLVAAHDQATDAWNGECAEQQKEMERITAAKLAERKAKYEFEWDGLRVIMPENAVAIQHEGAMLSHCVGGYGDRHTRGVLTILFLRRASAPKTPYVTIEMHGNKLIQIHGYQNDRNGKSPTATHKDFLDTWLKWLNAGSPRNEDGTPKLPMRVRPTA